MTEEWAQNNPTDSIFFRPRTEKDGKTLPMLWCYQSQWQKRLLALYGNQLVLLDATYRVCRYAVPLYFLCVKTNVCYIVVAAFITNSEQTQDIREGLEMIASWNPGFVPKRTLVDFAASQRNAVKLVWPSKCSCYVN